MANETLQLIITADNKEALKAIEDLAKSTSGLKTRFQEIKGDTNQAALALNNLSRVAQDAPYGFIGIANNINPLLESFQRLKDTTGSTTGAFKSMLSSLAGPAGIGLAVGALTSIIVAFGPKISQYIAQISEADMAQRKMNDSIAKATGSAQAEADKLTILNDIVKDSTLTTNERETALKQLQNTYKGNIELQKLDINDGQRLEVVINGITEALKRKALAQAFATLNNDSVSEITIISSGNQYETTPNIIISAPNVGVNTAIAVALMSPIYYTINSSTPISSGISTLTLDENLINTISIGTTAYFQQVSKIVSGNENLTNFFESKRAHNHSVPRMGTKV